jgi:hypothetical protein
MADVLTRLKVDSTEYDSKIKRAAQGLQHLAESARQSGSVLNVLEKENKDYIQSLGRMETVAKTARGRLSELTAAFTDIRSVYNSLSQEEKKGEFGRELNKQLEIMKNRIKDAKNELKDIDKELNGSGGKFGQLSDVVNTLGSKMGISGDLTSMLTSKTALMTGAIGASVAAVYKATEAWVGYNNELAKQDQITSVTTGISGPAADAMTDAARAMVDVYGVDFRDAINAANTLMTQFGMRGEEATQLIRDGLQGMIQGDGPKMLSMIQQFAPAFRDAGVSASQLVAVIHNSEGGIFTDQNMQAIVMGMKNIRLMTDATSEALGKLGIDGKKMSQELSNGSLTVFDALKQVAHGLQNVDSNSKAAGEVMQQVFGRQGVTAGTNLGKAIETLNTNLEETKKQTGEVGQAMADLQTANEKLNTAIRDCFEYDGWDEMAKGIRASLIGTLADVLDYIAKIKGELGGFSIKQYQKDNKNGGGANMDKMISMLGDGKSQKSKNVFDKQIQAFTDGIFRINDQIEKAEEQLKTISSNKMANIGDGATVGVATSTITQKIKELEKRREAIRKNMNEYERRANEIFNAPDEKKTTTVKPPKSPKPTGDNNTQKEQTEIQKNQKQINDLTNQYVSIMGRASAAGKPLTDEEKKQTEEIREQIKLLRERNGLLGHYQEQAQGRQLLKEEDINKKDIKRTRFNDLGLTDTKGVEESSKKPAQLSEKALKALQKSVDNQTRQQLKEQKAEDKQKTTVAEGLGNLAGGMSSIVGGLEQLGIEIPSGLKDVIGGMQAISSILTGIAATVLAIEAIAGADAIIPLATGGVVPKFAGGGLVKTFANGGLIGKAAGGMLIPGTSYSGDNLRMPVDGGRGFIGVNSGELILNESSQMNLSNDLQKAKSLVSYIGAESTMMDRNQRSMLASAMISPGMGDIKLEARATAEQLLFVQNNRGLRTGKGELVQSKRRR